MMKKEYKVLYVLALIKLMLPFLLQHPAYQLHRDEFLYAAEGHHLAWGYMEVPPLLSVFAWLSNLLGGGFFWIKFWPSLFGALNYMVVGRMILSLGGRSLALLLGFLAFIFGIFLRVHFLFQPNFLEIFFWTLISYGILRFIQTQKNSWLYMIGVCTGLGMISKYSVAFFIIALLLGALLTPQRKLFGNKHFYLSGALAFLIFLPTLYWEYLHHFPVWIHMQELKDTQLKYINPSGFLIDQVLMNWPCLFIWISGLYFTLFKEGRKYRLFAWTYLLVILILLYFQGKNYYSLGIYPVLFALGSCHLERFASRHSRIWKFTFISIPLILGIPIIPLMLPVSQPETLSRYYKASHLYKTGALQWEDQQRHLLPQDFADMLGWEEMAEKTAGAYSTLTAEEKKHTTIFADNYGEAGALTWYRKKYHLPQVYSNNATFLFWIPDHLPVDNLIVITDDKQEMQHSFIRDFRETILYDSITNGYAREKGSLIIILKGPNEKMRSMFRDMIQADRAKYEIK